MIDALMVVGITLVVIAIPLGLWRLSIVLRGRRLGSALAGAMAAHDQALHPTGYDTFVETRADADRTIARPAAPEPKDDPEPGPTCEPNPRNEG